MRKHNPCPVEKMYGSYPEFTICQLLRTIFHKTNDEEIRLLCRVGVTMGKAMDAKLRQYKQQWDDGFWDKNERT